MQGFDPAQVDAAMEFDPAWTADLRSRWQSMITIAVWDSLDADQLGASPRLRKRLLELGERMKSLVVSRHWIPHPRERLKSALASALALRETLSAIDGALPGLRPGVDTARLTEAFLALRTVLENELQKRESAWARMLDAQIAD